MEYIYIGGFFAYLVFALLAIITTKGLNPTKLKISLVCTLLTVVISGALVIGLITKEDFILAALWVLICAMNVKTLENKISVYKALKDITKNES